MKHPSNPSVLVSEQMTSLFINQPFLSLVCLNQPLPLSYYPHPPQIPLLLSGPPPLTRVCIKPPGQAMMTLPNPAPKGQLAFSVHHSSKQTVLSCLQHNTNLFGEKLLSYFYAMILIYLGFSRLIEEAQNILVHKFDLSFCTLDRLHVRNVGFLSYLPSDTGESEVVDVYILFN